MAYSQSKKINYSEKKLTQLKQQLYGKDLPIHSISAAIKHSAQIPTSNPTPTYLVKDLWRITVFASIAIIAQLALWYAVSHSWLTLY